ncbi:MAG: hypothetical protein ACRD8O_18870 [Bryobacteraceae bacterium]
MSRAEEKLRNPTPGGAIDRARQYGVDLSLLIERLRRTPEERLHDLQSVMMSYEAIRGKARIRHDKPPRDV